MGFLTPPLNIPFDNINLEILGNEFAQCWSFTIVFDKAHFTFACQVLEYHPEPWNQWQNVGDLNIERAYHAVHSIGTQKLPCFKSGDRNGILHVTSTASRLASLLGRGAKKKLFF